MRYSTYTFTVPTVGSDESVMRSFCVELDPEVFIVTNGVVS
jgi:hypothetical protein